MSSLETVKLGKPLPALLYAKRLLQLLTLTFAACTCAHDGEHNPTQPDSTDAQPQPAHLIAPEITLQRLDQPQKRDRSMIRKKRRVSPAGARQKGANFERELVHKFKEVFPEYNVRRGLQSRGGEEVSDVDCPVFWVEAKRGKRPSIRRALEQVTSDAPKGRIPIVVVKDDRKKAHVTMPLDDFLEIVARWWEGENQ